VSRPFLLGLMNKRQIQTAISRMLSHSFFDEFATVSHDDSDRSIGSRLEDVIQDMKQKGLTPDLMQDLREGGAHSLAHSRGEDQNSRIFNHRSH
jgi:hypothetical protein